MVLNHPVYKVTKLYCTTSLKIVHCQCCLHKHVEGCLSCSTFLQHNNKFKYQVNLNYNVRATLEIVFIYRYVYFSTVFKIHSQAEPLKKSLHAAKRSQRNYVKTHR